MILILFLVLLLCYLAAFLGAEQRKDARVLQAWWIAALATATAACGIFLWVLLTAAQSRSATQIAWIGIATRQAEDSLELGGSRQKATIGWPNGSFSPAIVAKSDSPSEANLRITGGGGFVRGPEGFLNGTSLPENQPTAVGAFSLQPGSLPGRICLSCRVSIRILDGAGKQVGQIEPRATAEPRVSSLYSNLSVDIARLRKSDGAAAQALEAWSSNLRLLVDRHEIRVLTPETDPVEAKIPLPARITVYWPAQSQPIDLKSSSKGNLDATFLPPWRRASPLPDPTTEGDSHLTLEARALPGDSAFLLPLGGDFRAFNETISLRNARFANPDKNRTGEFEKVLSQNTVAAGKYALRFASVHDLPDWPRVLLALLLALSTFGGGLWLLSPRFRWRDGWVLGGILTSIWVILSIRLLLSFRYALDPAHFDKFAFDGVASSFRALCLIPALIMIAARLRRDRGALSHFQAEAHKRRAGFRLLGYMLYTAVIAAVVIQLSHSLWPNVQARYSGSLFNLGSLFTTAIAAAALIWMLGYIYFLYFFDPEREASESFRATLDRLRVRTLRRITETFALEGSEGFWRHLGSTLDDEEEYDRRDYPTRLKVLSLTLLSLLGAASVIALITRLAGANEKFVQEVAAPFLLCWMPATIWLAARLRFRPGTRMSRRGYGWIVPWTLAAILLILAPVILFPILLGDAGGIVAAFSFFWPAVALLAAGGKPRRLQWMPMGALFFTLIAAGAIYLNLNAITKLPGEARVRLLIFKEGLTLQDRLLGMPLLKEDASQAPTVRAVSQGLQHTWENKAIAHEGGWFGLGFGKAPVRRSQVPQHTLQVDSTFSFFIASEFGFAGGLSLLGIYALPLIWVLIGARPRFDTGHGLATLIASAFLLEAIFHAGMNLTAFPYTGRDLPLLAVASFTDSVRWTLLFALAVRAMQWRAMGSEQSVETFRTESIISPPALPGTPESLREPLPRYRNAVIAVAALPLILLGITVAKSAQVVTDPELSRPFAWTRLLTAVRLAGDQGKLKVDPKTATITADESVATEGGTLLEQEIARFNALSESEKLEGVGGTAAEYRRRLRQVRSVADYDRLMAWLRTRDDEQRSQDRPLLFRLVADTRALDEEGRVLAVNRTYTIQPNPAFNTSVSFHDVKRQEIPAVSLRGQAAGTFLIRGRNFEFRVPNLPTKAYDERTVTLDEAANGAFRKIVDTNPDASDLRLNIRYKPENKKAKPLITFGEIRVTAAGVTFRPALDSRLIHPGALPRKVPHNTLQTLAPGDRIELAAAIGKNKIQPSFSIEKTAQGALIGPAWVMGNWIPTYDPDPLIPWTANLANAMPDEQARLKKDLPARLGTLTFDKNLQSALQTFATEQGRTHYQQYLGTAKAAREPLPPRVAISIIKIPSGEVVALGGWPRMNSGHQWDIGPDGDSIPPFDWVDQDAPHSLRLRYQGDRNFDRIAVGSASKPLWAAAVLRLHPGLEKQLETRGEDEVENDFFGIPIAGKGWAVHPSGWHDLAHYITESDNRYQVRLGFLGLASMAPAADSQSDKESMDGGAHAWHHYPTFEDVDFRPSRPNRLRGLEQTKLAERLKAMYGIGIETGEIVHRRSFWTGDEADDWQSAAKAGLSQSLEYTSPEAPNFEFNRVETPRQFITMLLGGGTNLWSNVDFAGAFGTCVLGLPVTPHITNLEAKLIKPTKERLEGFDNPQALYDGLKGVIDATDGTANPYLRATKGLAVLQNMQGVQHYAKTGTLGPEKGNNVSRIALALVKGEKKRSQSGLVISVVVENAPIGTASQWLGDFLVKSEPDLRRLMGLR